MLTLMYCDWLQVSEGGRSARHPLALYVCMRAHVCGSACYFPNMCRTRVRAVADICRVHERPCTCSRCLKASARDLPRWSHANNPLNSRRPLGN